MRAEELKSESRDGEVCSRILTKQVNTQADHTSTYPQSSRGAAVKRKSGRVPASVQSPSRIVFILPTREGSS